MQEFNRYLEKGTAIKRSFPGATASRLKYYIEKVPNEENIDRIIINLGTNNLSKKQSEEEILDEIIKIVSKCHTHGVNEIYVSGLTYRPTYQEQINKINKLLRLNSNHQNFKFIDNSDILERHLWKDRLHLNDQGTIILARNILDALNKHVYFDNFC